MTYCQVYGRSRSAIISNGTKLTNVEIITIGIFFLIYNGNTTLILFNTLTLVKRWARGI